MNRPEFDHVTRCFCNGESVENTIKSNKNLTKYRENLYFVFQNLRKICVQYFENTSINKLGGRNSTVVIDRNFDAGQKWHILQNENPIRVICIIDTFSGMGYLDVVNSNHEIAMNKIIARVIENGSPVAFTDRTTGEHVEEVEKYRYKYPDITEAIMECKKENDLNSYLKQIMWLERFDEEKAFYTLKNHIEAYHIPEKPLVKWETSNKNEENLTNEVSDENEASDENETSG